MAEEQKQNQQEQQVIVGTMQYRVTMGETDAYGVMYYANYFHLFERGRTELFRALGIEYKQILQQKQILMPVVETACRYMAPIVYDDLITIETAITNIESRGIRFDYRIIRDEAVLAVGFTQHIFIDPQGRPVSFGKEVLEHLKSKGLIKEATHAEAEPPKSEEDVQERLKKFVIEKIKEDKDN
ncbi:acyl-CoA thioesterase [Desulfurobacterium atlanticum]|uniref:Acyl-CoA thioester hydrolase n=1 Tax=Desulfurobacterium atlanticum TaxID=240169 RepID=A0A239AA59_9BACT|nr:thioesterase family protein [Desulfurobacterium atlanticum]SNR92292.1 acyl-CoA thioester hydrolase [Desulfurobacterium atlanticum]